MTATWCLREETWLRMELSTKRQLGQEVGQLRELEQVERFRCIPDVCLMSFKSPLILLLLFSLLIIKLKRLHSFGDNYFSKFSSCCSAATLQTSRQSTKYTEIVMTFLTINTKEDVY